MTAVDLSADEIALLRELLEPRIDAVKDGTWPAPPRDDLRHIATPDRCALAARLTDLDRRLRCAWVKA